ncbi:MAG: hypothetical protein IPN84_06630 [Sphingomonadales bacterium]|jgi:hypothetical protein|nr:hypothetical protein [Sphingomonadales bacterium]
MFDQLFRSRYKRECDLADAQNLIERHGPAALAAAKERASDGRLSPRNRRHWKRIARLVERIERTEQSGMTLVRND